MTKAALAVVAEHWRMEMMRMMEMRSNPEICDLEMLDLGFMFPTFVIFGK